MGSRTRWHRAAGGASAGLLGAVAAIIVLLGGRGPAASVPPEPSSAASSPSSTSAASGTSPILSQLDALPVKGRAPMTGYDRDLYGQRWSDAPAGVSGGRNGCDQRNDVLRRDLDDLAIKPGTRGCVALTGTLTDPYSGDHLEFVRGPSTSEEVPVDHVVSLGNAWQTGAQMLTPQQREALANDPLNLQATRRDLNGQKSDADAATWLPPAAGYRCTYVARQIAVKARYNLWVTPPEHAALARVLSSCADAQLDTSAWDVPDLDDREKPT